MLVLCSHRLHTKWLVPARSLPSLERMWSSWGEGCVSTQKETVLRQVLKQGKEMPMGTIGQATGHSLSSGPY